MPVACAMLGRSFFISTFVTRSRDESIHLRVRTTRRRAEHAVVDMFDYLAARMLAYWTDKDERHACCWISISGCHLHVFCVSQRAYSILQQYALQLPHNVILWRDSQPLAAVSWWVKPLPILWEVCLVLSDYLQSWSTRVWVRFELDLDSDFEVPSAILFQVTIHQCMLTVIHK